MKGIDCDHCYKQHDTSTTPTWYDLATTYDAEADEKARGPFANDSLGRYVSVPDGRQGHNAKVNGVKVAQTLLEARRQPIRDSAIQRVGTGIQG